MAPHGLDDQLFLLAESDLTSTTYGNTRQFQQTPNRFALKVAAACTTVGLMSVSAFVMSNSRSGKAVRGSHSYTAVQIASEDAPCEGRGLVTLENGQLSDPCTPLDESDMLKDIESGNKVHGDGDCSTSGQNCSATQCCAEKGMQCYVKDSAWAECKKECLPGPDVLAADGGHWTCDKLGDRTPGHLAECAANGDNCFESQCCLETGMQCYEKADGYGICKQSCVPGMDLSDVDSTPWSCKVLGKQTPDVSPWVAEECAAPGSGCLDKMCCTTPGTQCYEKNDYWGECKHNCTDPWTCKTRGPRTPMPAVAWQGASQIAAWVAEDCSATGEECSKTTCCSAPGNTCFMKNATWAVCRGSCAPGRDLYDASPEPWSCHVLGPKTPGVATSEPWKQGKPVAGWVKDSCSASATENCKDTKCCRGEGKQCYEKNDAWAACLTSCEPGPQPGDDNGNWTCSEEGPRTYRTWEKPSLYCFSVVQPFNYEPGLMKAQIGTGAGIFECDVYSVFSTKKFLLGVGPLGPLETVTFVPAPVVRSKDYTAGNAELFMHVWDSVKREGLYETTDWTVKADPDAVLLPGRLRWHLKPHTGDSAYMVNCAKPYMPEGPMMFGALEAISNKAIKTYFARTQDCIGGLPWKAWGEDLFMGSCLEKLGVERRNDFTIYSDGVCTGVNCADPDAAAFHPKKDIASWMACLNQTKHPQPRTTTVAPQWFKDYMASYSR